jgi:hypothetical protein
VCVCVWFVVCTCTHSTNAQRERIDRLRMLQQRQKEQQAQQLAQRGHGETQVRCLCVRVCTHTHTHSHAHARTLSVLRTFTLACAASRRSRISTTARDRCDTGLCVRVHLSHTNACFTCAHDDARVSCTSPSNSSSRCGWRASRTKESGCVVLLYVYVCAYRLSEMLTSTRVAAPVSAGNSAA